MTSPGSLELRLLGRFLVLMDGCEIPSARFGGRKTRTLLRILATRRGSFVPYEVLAAMLWGERAPAAPAANLQVLVNRARHAVEHPQLLVTGPGGYSMDAGDACVVDAEEFLQALSAARAGGRLEDYAHALSLWGEPLAEDLYEDWAQEYRRQLFEARQSALEEGAQLALDLGELDQAVRLASSAAAADPLREVAVLTLVRALAGSGDPAAALARYDGYRRALSDELGIDPSPTAQELHLALLRGSAVSATAAELPTEEPITVLPFLGRAGELRQLRDVLGTGGTALLSGPSGSGKSRLLAELSRSVQVVAVRAFPADRDEPWSLVRRLLREVLALDVTSGADLPPAIAAALVWLLPELEPVTGSAAPPDPESRRPLLVEATARMLAATCLPIVVDDLQWADATSAAVAGSALSRTAGLAAVLAFRPEEFAARPEVARVVAAVPPASRIELAPLTARDLARLTPDPALAAALADGTDGSPLAVTEALRALVRERAVRRSGQRWAPVTEAAVARAQVLGGEGQRAALLDRADLQPQGARDVLDLMALLAREAPAQLLAAASGREEREVLDTLGGLADVGLARLGEQGWTTAHDLVTESLSAALTPAARGRLHGLIAAALSAAGGDRGELARHWQGAADPERAARCYLQAAQDALDGGADGEAAALVGTGLGLAPTTSAAADLKEVRAQVRARGGDLAGARSDLRDALRSHPSGAGRARLLGRLAALASGAEDLVRAAELAELAIAEAGSDPSARAQALEIAAVLDMNLDRADRSRTRAGEALALYLQHGDARGAARVLDARAMATFLEGQVTEGTDQLLRAADLFEDTGDLLHVITPRSTAGHGLVFAGLAADGLELTLAALDLARALGNPEGQTYALWHSTEALSALARHDDALTAAREALEVARRLRHRGWIATGWRALGIAHHGAGELEEARSAFACSLDVSSHLNLFASWAAARCALVLVALGRLGEAEVLVRRALAEGPPLGHFEGRLAEVELAVARSDPRARELASQALRLADVAGVRQGRDRLEAALA